MGFRGGIIPVMKAMALTVLILAGLGTGLAIGFQTVPDSGLSALALWEKQQHLWKHAGCGVCAGFVAGLLLLLFTDFEKKD